MLVPGVDELIAGEPEAVAVENALRKARAGADQRPDDTVLGVDTVVSLGSQLYGKPQDPEEARATLAALSGRSHRVISGICLVSAGREATATETTTVQFRELDSRLLDWYVAGEEWRERAGGYAIQGRGGALVRRIEGDYLNVVGLPVGRLLEMAPWLLGASSV